MLPVGAGGNREKAYELPCELGRIVCRGSGKEFTAGRRFRGRLAFSPSVLRPTERWMRSMGAVARDPFPSWY